MAEKLTDQQKSVMLARAMGWEVQEIVGLDADIFAPPDIWVIAGSLYYPANMALAWLVLNWAYGNDMRIVGNGCQSTRFYEVCQ